jgi:hypothetical protein
MIVIEGKTGRACSTHENEEECIQAFAGEVIKKENWRKT